MSVSDVVSPTYKRDPNRLEGFIKPEANQFSTIKIGKDPDYVERELAAFEN